MLEITETHLSAIEDYARVPIRFTVNSVLDLTLESGGLDGVRFTERRLAQPYIKDYDADPGSRPAEWSRRFDTSGWGVIVAQSGKDLVGGVTIAFGTSNLDLLERREDLAVLWDARVAPAQRRTGAGAALFAAAERWARERGCKQLKVETQNINVPACRFYRAQGCTLGGFNRFAYPSFPDEIQILWYKQLVPHVV